MSEKPLKQVFNIYQQPVEDNDLRLKIFCDELGEIASLIHLQPFRVSNMHYNYFSLAVDRSCSQPSRMVQLTIHAS